MKNKKMKQNKGFTLIELIVSITIIAVLTVVGVISYGGVNKKARDGRRMSDLEKIRIALEIYRQDLGGTYPSDIDELAPKYIQILPQDPKEKTDYGYTQTGTGYTYTIDAIVEDAGSSNFPDFVYRVNNP